LSRGSAVRRLEVVTGRAGSRRKTVAPAGGILSGSGPHTTDFGITAKMAPPRSIERAINASQRAVLPRLWCFADEKYLLAELCFLVEPFFQAEQHFVQIEQSFLAEQCCFVKQCFLKAKCFELAVQLSV
jgi:hypothetical protein